MICSVQQVVLAGWNKGEWERQRIWNVWGGRNNYIGFMEKRKEKNHIEDLGVNGKVILKYIINKRYWRA